MKNWADAMIRELDQSRSETGHIGLVRNYLKGAHRVPYMPDDATGEFNTLAQQSITNYLPLIGGTFGKQLYVDGYRTGKSAANVDGWRTWNENKLTARQAITMRGAIDYGTAYVAVEGSKIRTLSARKSHAWYQSDEDEHPIAGLADIGERIADDGTFLARYEFWYQGKVLTYERTTGRRAGVADDPANPRDGRDVQVGTLELVKEEDDRHPHDFVPWVRFRDRLDDEAVGLIRPLITLQDRINASVFYLLMALHYASFRQRWGTGLMIPRDTQETLPDGSANPNFGKPIEPFKAAVNRLWISENPDTKFGDFAQTDTTGHLSAIENAVQTLITIGQSSPLLGAGNSVSNIALESIAALNESMYSQVEALKASFGPSWESVFELAGAGDASASVRWRDTEPRSFGVVVDGLVKLQTMGAPAEGLFDMVPGITDETVEEWKTLAARETETDRLAAAISRQAAPAVGAGPEVAPPAGMAVPAAQ